MSYSYQKWVFHGEEIDFSSNIPTQSSVNDNENSHVEEVEDDEMIEMLHDIGGTMPINIGCGESNENYKSGVHINVDQYDDLFDQAKKELYSRCKTFSVFTFLVKSMHVKVLSRWSNKSFDMLQILKKAFLEGANIPASYYDAKKMLRDLGLGYETIHVC